MKLHHFQTAYFAEILNRSNAISSWNQLSYLLLQSHHLGIHEIND